MAKRKGYKNYESELYRFENDAWEYLNRITYKKTIKKLCEHLGITPKTLSKYKQRNYLWREVIEEIKQQIRCYNYLLLNGGIKTIVGMFLDQSPKLLEKNLYEEYEGKPKELYEMRQYYTKCDTITQKRMRKKGQRKNKKGANSEKS